MAKTKPWLDSLGGDLMNRLPDDPEAEIMQRLRGEQAGTPPPAGEDSTTGAPAGTAEVPADDGAEPPADESAEAPADEDPGYAPDDQNQLQRQLEQPAD
jgi:membrane protein required for colicin V production